MLFGGMLGVAPCSWISSRMRSASQALSASTMVREPRWSSSVSASCPSMRLPRSQAEPDWEALRIDDDVDLRREAASGATEAVICTLLFAVAACWCARTEVLSIIWMSPSCAAVMASISRSHTLAFRHRT